MLAAIDISKNQLLARTRKAVQAAVGVASHDTNTPVKLYRYMTSTYVLYVL